MSRHSRCYWTQFFSDPCSGRFDRCHIGFEKRVLKREWSKHFVNRKLGKPYNEKILALTKGEFIDDPRVIREGCRWHHEASHSAWWKQRRDQLPLSVLEFAREFNLEHLLPAADGVSVSGDVRRPDSPSPAAGG